LGAIIVVEFLGDGEGLLLHAHVFTEADEIVIEACDAGDGAGELLAEDFIRDLAIVLGDAEEAAIETGAEAAKKGLADGETAGGAGVGL